MLIGDFLTKFIEGYLFEDLKTLRGLGAQCVARAEGGPVGSNGGRIGHIVDGTVLIGPIRTKS